MHEPQLDVGEIAHPERLVRFLDGEIDEFMLDIRVVAAADGVAT
jgi:hypothetical protein